MDFDPDSLQAPREIAAYLHQSMAPLRDVMIAAHEHLRQHLPQDGRGRALFEAFMRATSWIKTVAKLDDASDIQAIHAASRALSEIAIDMALLHADSTDGNAEKLLAYEQSQKLSSANKYRAYADSHGGASPEYQPQIDFISQQEANIKALRLKFWGTEKPPKNTWTGHDLGRNARDADCGACSCWSSNGSMEQQYAEHNARANWGTHGSGGTLFRGQPDLDPLNAVAMREVQWSASVCIQIVVHEFPELMQNASFVGLLERLALHLTKEPS